MNRQFNPSETIRINRGKLPKPVETSLTLFLTTLTDHADDERITTKPGRVELADTVAGKSIVWILDVTASVNRSLIGDEHLSMSVKSGEESKSSRERRLCVRRLGDCPVGDHLAIVIHLFHNDMLMKTIPELRRAALRATNPRQSWHCPVDENAEVWRDLYAIIEERPAADIEYLTTAHPMPLIFTNPPYSTPPWDCEGARNFILNLDPQVMLDMVRRIYELDPDLLHNLTTENRRQMFLGMIEEPITTDIRRYIIARLETGLDAQPPLLRIQEMVERNVPGYEDPEGTLLRTVNYALERIRARQDSNPRSPA